MKVVLYGIVDAGSGHENYTSSAEIADLLVPTLLDGIAAASMSGDLAVEIDSGSFLIPAKNVCYVKIGTDLTLGFNGFSKQVLEQHGFESNGAWNGPAGQE